MSDSGAWLTPDQYFLLGISGVSMYSENMFGEHAPHGAHPGSSVGASALSESEGRRQKGVSGPVARDAEPSTGSPFPSRLLKTTDALELAMYTFGDFSTAEAWMQEPQVHLCGSPVQVCLRPGGQDQVLQLLYAIAGGTEP